MKNAFLSLHLSILLAGWTGIFGKLIDLSAYLVVWWRVAVGGLVLWAIVAVLKKLQATTWRERLGMLALGAFLGFQWIGFYAAIKASNVSIGVVSFSTVGFFTALFEPLMERRRPSLKEIGFSLLTIAGIALIFHFDSRYRLGIFYGVLSAAGAALIAILMKRCQRRHNAQTVLLWEFAGAFVALTAGLPLLFHAAPERHNAQTVLLWEFAGAFVALTAGLPLLFHAAPATAFWPALWPDALWILIFATVVTIGMYLLQLAALKHVSAFTVNLSYNLEPVYSILIAMVLFDEAHDLNAAFWGGLALIGLSVVLQTVSVLRKRPSEPHEVPMKR